MVTRYLSKKVDQIEKAAAISIAYTSREGVSSFTADEIRNRNIRHQISQIGFRVTVYFNENEKYPDSCVVFTNSGLSKEVDIVYAFTNKQFEKISFSSEKESLLKITNNIYYTRVKRPFPIM